MQAAKDFLLALERAKNGFNALWHRNQRGEMPPLGTLENCKNLAEIGDLSNRVEQARLFSEWLKHPDLMLVHVYAFFRQGQISHSRH